MWIEGRIKFNWSYNSFGCGIFLSLIDWMLFDMTSLIIGILFSPVGFRRNESLSLWEFFISVILNREPCCFLLYWNMKKNRWFITNNSCKFTQEFFISSFSEILKINVYVIISLCHIYSLEYIYRHWSLTI